MKKIIAVCSIVLLMLCCSCQLSQKEKEITTNTDYMAINDICVNDSYTDENGSSLRMVYLFYTLNAKDTNLQIDSSNTIITIDDNNSYESGVAVSDNPCKYITNYYYSNYIADVYVGESKQVVATFTIPEAELTAGHYITIQDDQIPDIDKIYLTTDMIKHFNNVEELSAAMDSAGYEEIIAKREEADEATTAAVKSLINGYYWTFYINNTSYEIEFWEDNNFEVRTNIGGGTQADGTYSVRNGYIFCTYPNAENSIEIPYEIKDGNIEMDFITAFDVKK